MSVAIIDYGSGNLRSASKAFEQATREPVHVTSDAKDLTAASHIVLPGVGSFVDCKTGLAAVPGMIDAITEQVVGAAKPFLGICVGMQLMADIGREHEEMAGLGWIPGVVQAIEPDDSTLKIPHMGWNELSFTTGIHSVLDGIGDGAHAYFVHSYSLVAANVDQVLAEVDYGGPITAIVCRDNLLGTQFHPEKSQRIGLRFIENFLCWRP